MAEITQQDSGLRLDRLTAALAERLRRLAAAWPRRLRLHGALLLLLAGMVLVLDSVLIPFHAGDDDDHFSAAYAAAQGHLGPERSVAAVRTTSSWIDPAIPAFARSNFHATRLVSRPDLRPTAWTGRDELLPVPLSSYMPLVYLPQIAAIKLYRGAGASLQATIHAARVANGLAALAIIGLALIMLPETLGLFVLVLIGLPKWMQLFASNSADPMDVAIAMAVLAFCCRAQTAARPPAGWHFALAALGVMALGGARPPLLAMALPLAWAAWHHRSWRGLAATGTAVALCLAWWASVLPYVRDARTPVTGTFAEKTIQFAVYWPTMIAQTLAERGQFYLATFVGEMGYGDARSGQFYALPLWSYAIAGLIIALGLAALGDRHFRSGRATTAVHALTGLAVIGGIFLSLAAGCTNLGEMTIQGVQGRYFMIPLAVLAAAGAGALPPVDRAAALLRQVLPLYLLCNFTMMAGLGIVLYWSW